jgi:hypothetical protein
MHAHNVVNALPNVFLENFVTIEKYFLLKPGNRDESPAALYTLTVPDKRMP